MNEHDTYSGDTHLVDSSEDSLKEEPGCTGFVTQSISSGQPHAK